MAMSQDSMLLNSLIIKHDVDGRMGDPGRTRRKAEKRSSRGTMREDMGCRARRRRTGSGFFFFVVLSGSISFKGERDGE
jgi:hypothetical protein